mmetsp:Transcript_2644/g.10144  ORF Transcript_2644/g.10144 Transcript_2644/m.10144 type:complete len:237 (-) Transcript_2644:122-832(-)
MWRKTKTKTPPPSRAFRSWALKRWWTVSRACFRISAKPRLREKSSRSPPPFGFPKRPRTRRGVRAGVQSAPERTPWTRRLIPSGFLRTVATGMITMDFYSSPRLTTPKWRWRRNASASTRTGKRPPRRRWNKAVWRRLKPKLIRNRNSPWSGTETWATSSRGCGAPSPYRCQSEAVPSWRTSPRRTSSSFPAASTWRGRRVTEMNPRKSLATTSATKPRSSSPRNSRTGVTCSSSA